MEPQTPEERRGPRSRALAIAGIALGLLLAAANPLMKFSPGQAWNAGLYVTPGHLDLVLVAGVLMVALSVVAWFRPRLLRRVLTTIAVLIVALAAFIGDRATSPAVAREPRRPAVAGSERWADDGKIRFVVVGDTGHLPSRAEEVVARIMELHRKEPFEAVLLLGDQVDQRSAIQMTDIWHESFEIP
jgi:hypothetical protein